MAGNDLGDLLGQFMQAMLEKQQRGNAERAEAARRGQSLPHAPSRPAQPPSGRPPLVAAEIVEAEPVTGDDVAEHVQRHLSTSEFTQRAARLGDEVVHAPDDIQQHIADVFGHGPKGRLTGDKPTVATPGDASTTFAPASDFAKLLRSPQDLRMAFIMSEVLRRPEW